MKVPWCCVEKIVDNVELKVKAWYNITLYLSLRCPAGERVGCGTSDTAIILNKTITAISNVFNTYIFYMYMTLYTHKITSYLYTVIEAFTSFLLECLQSGLKLIRRKCRLDWVMGNKSEACPHPVFYIRFTVNIWLCQWRHSLMMHLTCALWTIQNFLLSASSSSSSWSVTWVTVYKGFCLV